MGRENLSTSGWMNELTRVLRTKYTRSVGKAYGLQNRTIGDTTLHYLAVWQAIHVASVPIPLRSKITLIYSLTYQTNCFTPQ